MTATITAIGNEGFQIEAGGRRVFVDAFYRPWPGAEPCLQARDVKAADLILVTHAHADHFDPGGVAAVAARTRAPVVAPAAAIRALRGAVPESMLVEMEPEERRRGQPADSAQRELPAARITAYRTFHLCGHNSYLVDVGGFRFFHDGDNEETRGIPTAELGRVDALFIGPWQGAGWVEFIEALRPRRWFLMHLDADEWDRHERGVFLPELCDHIPEGLVALRPGQTFEMPMEHIR